MSDKKIVSYSEIHYVNQRWIRKYAVTYDDGTKEVLELPDEISIKKISAITFDGITYEFIGFRDNNKYKTESGEYISEITTIYDGEAVDIHKNRLYFNTEEVASLMDKIKNFKISTDDDIREMYDLLSELTEHNCNFNRKTKSVYNGQITRMRNKFIKSLDYAIREPDTLLPSEDDLIN